MERRFYWGVVLLAVLLSLGIGSWLGMKAIHEPSEKELLQAAQLGLSGNLEQAIPLAERSYQRWQRYRCVTASVADHAPMDDTENLFAEVRVYAAAGEEEHFAACCQQLSNMTKAMYDAHCFTLWNLL